MFVLKGLGQGHLLTRSERNPDPYPSAGNTRYHRPVLLSEAQESAAVWLVFLYREENFEKKPFGGCRNHDDGVK